MRLKFYITESDRNIIEDIKNYLIWDGGYDSWKEVVDNQEVGDCQYIAVEIERVFKNRGVKRVFGRIETDNGEKITHHWVTIKGVPYDFSKGTLKYYIDFRGNELYDPEISDESIYHKLR